MSPPVLWGVKKDIKEEREREEERERRKTTLVSA
jgi:hypothetical protein